MINMIIDEVHLSDFIKDNGMEYVRYPDELFSSINTAEIINEVENIVREVEGTTLYGQQKIISKFTGEAIDIGCLSSGSKTVIYVYSSIVSGYVKKRIIDVTCCGANAIEYILKSYRGSDVTLYCGHLCVPMDMNIDMCVNGIKISNTKEIFEMSDEIFGYDEV